MIRCPPERGTSSPRSCCWALSAPASPRPGPSRGGGPADPGLSSGQGRGKPLRLPGSAARIATIVVKSHLRGSSSAGSRSTRILRARPGSPTLPPSPSSSSQPSRRYLLSSVACFWMSSSRSCPAWLPCWAALIRGPRRPLGPTAAAATWSPVGDQLPVGVGGPWRFGSSLRLPSRPRPVKEGRLAVGKVSEQCRRGRGDSLDPAMPAARLGAMHSPCRGAVRRARLPRFSAPRHRRRPNRKVDW